MDLSRFSRVVIWGHPLHSHTHSYIHEGFARAFRHLGCEVWWMADQPMYPAVDLTDALVLTEGQVCRYLPRDPRATYILHNCDLDSFADVLDRSVRLQVLAYSAIQPPGATSLAPGSFHVPGGPGYGTLFQPWGTDLLPPEIDEADASFPRDRVSRWVGSLGHGQFGNLDQVEPWQRACEERGVAFVPEAAKTDQADARALLRAAYLAPAIVGAWQLEHGYIPCRIFKNMSYGQLGVTNSPAVNEVFGGTLVQNTNTYDLFFQAEEALAAKDALDRIRAGMREVAEKHTYLNRIARLLEVMG